MSPHEPFEIPDPPPEFSTNISLFEQQSLEMAALELNAYENGKLTPRQANADWKLRFTLRTVFFFFALMINLWWDNNVRLMIWQSGRLNSGFHLDNSILIALLTTSIANFLALLTIIASHLFQKPPAEKLATKQSS